MDCHSKNYTRHLAVTKMRWSNNDRPFANNKTNVMASSVCITRIYYHYGTMSFSNRILYYVRFWIENSPFVLPCGIEDDTKGIFLYNKENISMIEILRPFLSP